MRKKPPSPMAEIVAHQHLEVGGMPLTALVQRHRQRAIDGVADPFRIVRIDQQRGRAFVRGARKAREDQHARIVRILCGHEFLRDQIHAIAQRRHQPGARGTVKARRAPCGYAPC